MTTGEGMMPPLSYGRCPWMLALLLLAGGCKGKTEGLVPVSGKVSYRGMAVQQGTIVFTPDPSRGNQAQMAVGEIGRDGSYSVHTGNTLGAATGWYRVTVAAILADSSVPGQSYRPPISLLPDRYRDPELSKLACEIKGDKINTIDFQLD